MHFVGTHNRQLFSTPATIIACNSHCLTRNRPTICCLITLLCLQKSSEIRDKIEIVHTSEYGNFLKNFVPVSAISILH
jgi:hypothetical protein